MLPALGSILLEDDFSDSAPWQTGRSSKGLITINSQSINLAVQAGYGTLQSLRSQPSPADYYAEIDIHFNLCSSQDLAGMIFNALDSGTMYRALVRCDGQVSVEQVSNYNYGYVKKWTPGMGFGAGALQKVRLGVWQADGEVRIFVNDAYQFTVQLPQNSAGQVGVFARAGGSDPVTMSFTDLVIRSVDPAAVPTRTPLP